MGFVRRFSHIVAYLLYTLAVLAFMLWYQFPADAAKTRLESELDSATPALQWKIGSIGLTLPADIHFADIRVSSLNRNKTEVTIDSLSLRPDLPSYLNNRKLSAGYRLDALHGRVRGRLILAADYNSLHFEGKVTGMQIQEMQPILQQLDRTVSGTMSGSFTGMGQLRGPVMTELQGNLLLVQGEIGFQKPVLGMEQLAFNRLSSSIRYEKGVIHLEDGTIESRLLAGEFSGTVKPVPGDIGRSTLDLNGALIPRPEFLSGVGDDMTVEVLKRHLQEGTLPFTINGLLKEPGIVFAGLPADFNKRLQGGR